MNFSHAESEIHAQSGRMYDPLVVDAFRTARSHILSWMDEERAPFRARASADTPCTRGLAAIFTQLHETLRSGPLNGSWVACRLRAGRDGPDGRPSLPSVNL